MRSKQLSYIISCIALVFLMLSCDNFEGNIEELRPININIALTASSETLTLAWNAVKNAAEYEVYCNKTNSITGSPDFRASGSQLRQTISGLENGTTYYCHVKVIRADGNSKISAMAIGKPVGNMGTVTVTAEESGELILGWSAVAGADEYEIYYAASMITNINNAKLYRTVSNTQVTITGLANGTVYNVWVIPKNAYGYGNESPRASGRTLVTPGQLAVIAANQQITLSWGELPDAIFYNVYYNTNTITDVTGLSTIITGLVNGITYNFWVEAVFSDGTISLPSDMASGVPIGNMGTVTVTAEETGELKLNWSAVAGALQYEVYYSTGGVIPASPSQTVSTTTATISGLANGTVYNVWVKSKNANGYGNASPMASGRTLVSPGLLSVVTANQQITISWGYVPDATGYNVYYDTSATMPASPADNVTGLSKIITGLANGAPYYFWVTAVFADGTISLPSDMASGVPIGNMSTVTIAAGGGGELIVEWSSVAGALQYEVYYGTSNTMPLIPSQTVSATIATISDLDNGTDYNVWVRPINANGAGNAAEASMKTLVMPGELTVRVEGQQITISWDMIQDAISYDVYYDTIETMPSLPADNVTGLNKTITGIAGTPYYFRIKANFTSGITSLPSNMASGTPIGNMGTVTIAAGGSRRLDLNWSAVAGADEYEVYRGTNSTMPENPSQTVSTTTVTISGLTNGTEYNVWVKPINANGFGNESPMASGTTLVAPGNLTIVVADQQVNISWGQVDDAVSYNIYYNTTGLTPDPYTATPNTNVTVRNVSVTGLVNGTTYYFWAAAVFVSGKTGGPSPMASGTPLGIPTATVSSAYKQLLVEWENVAGALLYDVYRSTSNSRPASPTFTNIAGLSMEITGLNNGTTYYIWVKAKNSDADSNPASTMKSGTPGIPSPGLYIGARNIPGSSTLNTYLDYISTNAVINGDYYIVLGANDSISDKDLECPAGAVVTLLGYNQETTIDLNADTAMFYINYGVTLILGENITLTGSTTNNYSLVCLDGGNLIINDGAKITGNTASIGGGVYIAAGELIMNGGTISGNTADSGGGVYVCGNFTMKGGTISGNEASSFGGGVYVDDKGVFQKQGGTVYGNGAGANANTAAGAGAAVYKSRYPKPSVYFRDTTAGPADIINTITGQGLN
ncbi:MAG: fibronectin type III domain-containing protein [Treponema sp.]|nr:fibronectin type III domain-containing protein [Treponema sp.]